MQKDYAKIVIQANINEQRGKNRLKALKATYKFSRIKYKIRKQKCLILLLEFLYFYFYLTFKL
jgi:hypothetical protein